MSAQSRYAAAARFLAGLAQLQEILPLLKEDADIEQHLEEQRRRLTEATDRTSRAQEAAAQAEATYSATIEKARADARQASAEVLAQIERDQAEAQETTQRAVSAHASAEAKAAEMVSQAQAKASGIVAEAEEKAAGIVSGAQAAADDLIASLGNTRSELAELQTEIEARRVERDTLNSEVEALLARLGARRA